MQGTQRSILMGKLWVALLALAVSASWGCGGSASAGGPTPTPTPTPAPTATPPPLPAGTIGMKVLNTSVPPGGIFQFQLSNTEPKPIGHGSTRPQVPSGPVRGVAVNDPSGQAAGIAVIDTSVSPSNIKIQLSSPDALLGTDITYPVVTMSMPLSSSLSPGATFPLSIDTGSTSFFDATKAYTALEFAPGTLTIAPVGSPYISDVLPAGGLLPDRTLIKVFGAGFNANTRVSIEGTTIVPADQTVVNSGEVDVKICNGTVADGATTCPGTGATFQLDGERVRVKDTNTNFVLEYYTYLRGGRRSRQQRYCAGEPDSSHVLSGDLSLCHHSTGEQRDNNLPALSLQNTNALASGIKIELLDASNASIATPVTFILPGIGSGRAGSKITRDVVADWFPSPPSGAAKVRVTVTSGPAVQVLGMLGDTSSGTVSPVIPQ